MKLGGTWLGCLAALAVTLAALEHVAEALLDGKYEGRCATADLVDSDQATPLMRASWGHEAVVRLLLSRGAKQELQDRKGWTALHYAVISDCPDVVALLCAAPGAATALAIKTDDSLGSCTPLELAISYDRAACEAVLRTHGAPE